MTALALEDNELWHRHFLQFVAQLGVTVYVFIQSFQRRDYLWLPTILMFTDGCIKYGERISALYSASADAFRDSVATEPESGPSYSWLMEEYYAATSAHIPATLQRKADTAESATKSEEELYQQAFEGSPLNNEAVSSETDPDYSNMVKEAYYFYVKFKGLLADALISFEDRKQSRDYFLSRPGLTAVKTLEIELNIIYDVFYTKAFLLQKKRAYLRGLTSLSVIASFLLFTLRFSKDYKGIDLAVTYALLGGAIALDICAAVMFLFSDWWIIVMSPDNGTTVRSWKWQFLSQKLLKWSNWVTRPRHRTRWCQSISQYNLLKRCLKDPPAILDFIFVKRVKDGVIGWLYSDTEDAGEDLVKFIVQELKAKATLLVSEDLNAIKEVCSARGNLVLQTDYSLISEYLYPWTLGIDYDESLLTWHFATDICYLSSNENYKNKPSPAAAANQTDYRKLSKLLSDYMSSVLLTKKTMVSSVVGKSEMLFEDTRAEVKKLIKTKMVDFLSTGISHKLCGSESKKEEEFLEQFSKRVLESYVRPMMDKGERSKYVLFNARSLAQQLNQIGEEQWVIMSKVWLELLCYAAIRCPPRSHVAQLSKGGELITLVWLFMTHLGLAECFLQNQGLRWTKLIIPK